MFQQLIAIVILDLLNTFMHAFQSNILIIINIFKVFQAFPVSL